MPLHFLLTARAKTLSLAQVFRMTDEEAETAFRRVRWAETDGAAVCIHCGGVDAYDCRRPKGAPRFRCRACKKDFTITSGTLFASHKLPLRAYLAAIAIFCNEVKGKSALALSRDINVQYKTAFVLSHKIREAIASEMKGAHVFGCVAALILLAIPAVGSGYPIPDPPVKYFPYGFLVYMAIGIIWIMSVYRRKPKAMEVVQADLERSHARYKDAHA